MWGEASVRLTAPLNEHVMASEVANQKIPERFEFVDDYPRTVSGKTHKELLRANIKGKLV